MLGIEKLKSVVSFGITLGSDVADALADKKITWTEAPRLLLDLVGIGDILSAKDEIIAEFKDLTTEERAELNDYIAASFDIANDVLELKIEKAIAAAIAVLDLVDAFKKAA